MFDPIAWAIGFGATHSTRALLERLYPDDLRSKLRKATEKWASELPSEVKIEPEELINDMVSGPCRERLQIRLFLHNHVPDQDLWFYALEEAWEAIRGTSELGFFTQPRESAGRHIRKLAKALVLACSHDPKLFQVSTLHQLEEIASRTVILEREMGITISLLLNSLESIKNISYRPHLVNQKAICRLLENPHLCHG